MKALYYYGRKALAFFISILALSLVVFYVSRLAPGDPLVSYYGVERAEKMSREERALAEERLGLRDPVPVQYSRWLERAVHGDFGISYKYKMDVSEVIAGRIGNTLLLGGLGFVLIFVMCLLLGILCAWFEGKLFDRLICKMGTVTSCIPEFWLSLALILIFAVYLPIFPSSGAYTVGRAADVGDWMRHLVLPLTVVVVGHLWYYAYMVRNKVIEEIHADYVLFARAKGLGRGKIMFGHCLRNVMPSYLSIMAISIPHVMGGTYIVETVFSYPGLGALVYESARYKDYDLLMVLCILSGGVVILCSMAAQAISERIDPRIKAEETGKLRLIRNEESAGMAREIKGGDGEGTAKEEGVTERETAAEKSRVTGNGNDVKKDRITKGDGIAEDRVTGKAIAATVGLASEGSGRFAHVGIRPLPDRQEKRRIKWYTGKPVFSIALLLAILLGCFGCELFMTKDPTYMDLANFSLPPGGGYLFGTDTMGRDIFSMIWYGGRVSVLIGFLATGISVLVAVLFGTVSGLAPKWLDDLLMRFAEIVLSIPGLLLVVLIQAAIGKAGVWSLSLVIALTSWMSIAKVVRTEVRQIRGSEYVIASKCMGGGFFHILWNHLAPNFFPSIMFMVVMNVRSAIISESTLSFMGIGLPLEVVSWGSMLSLSENALLSGYWWMFLFPGVFLVATLACVTEIGNYYLETLRLRPLQH